MSAFQTVQKIVLLVLIGVSVPIFAMNFMLPRLAIATGGVEVWNFDLTCVSYTNASGYPSDGYNTSADDTALLDFWLEVGLPIGNDPARANQEDKKWQYGTGGYDARYFLSNGSVNVAHLKDPGATATIPIIRLTAEYKNKVLGTGGSVRAYTLDKNHPIEYVHLYLLCDRMTDGGLMYLFNSLTTDGVLDQIIISALSGGALSLDSVLNGLKLDITYYLGGAPIALPLDASFFMGGSPFPAVKPSAVNIQPNQFVMNPNNSIIYYDYQRQVGGMERLLKQLQLDDLENLLPLFATMGVAAQIDNLKNALFDNSTIPYNCPTVDTWWINGTDIETDAMYNAAELESLLATELATYNISYGGPTFNGTFINANLGNGSALRTYLVNWASAAGRTASMNSLILQNQNSWFYRRHVLAQERLPLNLPFDGYFNTADTPVSMTVENSIRGNVTFQYIQSLGNLFGVMAVLDYGLGDIFQALHMDVPQVMSKLLFGSAGLSNSSNITLFGQPYAAETPELNAEGQYYDIQPEIVVYGMTSEGLRELSSFQISTLVLLTVLASFLIVFLLLAITKGSVKINRSDFLGRENVSRNVKDFISRVEQLGGKVSVQNAESLTIRAFRTEGKIDRPADVEKRAKTYVENQKLLVTLQSRASRAYVAQKFKDCIGAIEKMIQIARKLEDMTLVQNYEENLAKVVRLLRRKGISVSTKVRVEEGAKPGEEVEQLSAYKKELIDLQNRASKAFAEKNFSDAKESIKQMLAIAKKIQDPVLIRNYEANLRKIIAMEKGGSV